MIRLRGASGDQQQMNCRKSSAAHAGCRWSGMAGNMSRAWTFMATQRAIAAQEYELESGSKVSIPSLLPTNCAEKDKAPPGNQVWRIFKGTHETMLAVVPEDFLTVGCRLRASILWSRADRPELGMFAGTELKLCPTEENLGKDKLIKSVGVSEFPIASKPRASVCAGLAAHPDYPTGYAGSGRGGDLEEAARRTNLSTVVELPVEGGSKSHPLSASEALYMGASTTLRGQGPEYPWLPDPVSLPIVAVCKPAKTSWVSRESRSGETGLRPTADAELRRACYSMCRSVLARAQDVLVVGRGFAAQQGRGVPPLAMARALRQVVATYFPGCFRLVVSAVEPTAAALEKLQKAGWGKGVRAGEAAAGHSYAARPAGTPPSGGGAPYKDELGEGREGGRRGGSTAGGSTASMDMDRMDRLDQARRSASTASERSAGAASIVSSASVPAAGGARERHHSHEAGHASMARSPGRTAPAGVLAALAGSPRSAMGSGVSSALGSHSPAAPSWAPQSPEDRRLVEADPYLAFRHVWLGSAAFVPAPGANGAGIAGGMAGWGLGLGLGVGAGASAGTDSVGGSGSSSRAQSPVVAEGDGRGGFRGGYVPPSLGSSSGS